MVQAGESSMCALTVGQAFLSIAAPSMHTAWPIPLSDTSDIHPDIFEFIKREQYGTVRNRLGIYPARRPW